MKEKQDYIRDIAEIRSMMERSSKFLSLAGWAGIMAGIYALAGAVIAAEVLHFSPEEPGLSFRPPQGLTEVVGLAIIILVLAIATAALLSYRKAQRSGEQIWNATSKRLLGSMGVPLVTGGSLMIIFMMKGMAGLLMPLSLIFYGLAIFTASRYTYDEVRTMGLIEIALGLLSCYFIGHALLFWALGFGVVHIFYGIYLYYRYER